MSFVNETKTTPIQNDTGANVRADINSNMAAIYSLNASSSEPSADSSVARMIWADETNNELKIRNGTNTSFITIGSLNETNLGLALKASPTFTGNVGVPAGTVSSLPIRRSDDTNTGIYFSAADTLDIATGGTRRAHFDTNGITIRDRKALRLRDTSNSNFVALRAPDNAASDITLTLPSSDGNANDVLQSDGSGNLSFTALPQAVPSGTVHLFATTTAPTGYLECDGSSSQQDNLRRLCSRSLVRRGAQATEAVRSICLTCVVSLFVAGTTAKALTQAVALQARRQTPTSSTTTLQRLLHQLVLLITTTSFLVMTSCPLLLMDKADGRTGRLERLITTLEVQQAVAASFIAPAMRPLRPALPRLLPMMVAVRPDRVT